MFGRELYNFFNLDHFFPLVSLLYFLFMPNCYHFYCLLSNFLFHLITWLEIFLMDHNFVASNVCSILKVSALKEGKIQWCSYVACFYDPNFLKVNFPISPQNSWCLCYGWLLQPILRSYKILVFIFIRNSPPGFKTAALNY